MATRKRTPPRPISAEDILRLAVPLDPQIDFDGSRVAYAQRRAGVGGTYTTELFIGRTDGSALPRRATTGPRDRAPRFAPDGTRLSFVREEPKGSPQLMLAAATGVRLAKPKLLTSLLDGSIGDIRWSPDGRTIAFAFRATDPDRTHAASEVRARTKASTPPLVIDDPWYRLDGDGVFGAARYRLHLLDVASRRVREIALGDTLGMFSFDWSPDSRHLAATVNRSKDALIAPWKCEVVTVVARTGRVTAVAGLPTGPKGSIAWSPDGNSLAWAGRNGRGSMYSTKNLGLFVHRLGSRRAHNVLSKTDLCMMAATLSDSAEAGFSSWFRWMPDSESLIMRVGWHGSGHIASVSATGGLVTLHTPAGVEHIPATLAANGSRIALVRTSPIEPAEVCVADIYGREFPIRQLSEGNSDFLDSVALAMPEENVTRARDGALVHYWVLRPPAGVRAQRKTPAILEVHGGPHAQYGWCFFHEFQLLAASGWTVYYGNPRGSKGYGAKACAAIGGSWGGKDWLDVQAITREMKRDRLVDRKRIGIMGGSYGGYMTAWAISHSRDYAGAISDRCVSNIVSHCGSSDFPEVPGEYWPGTAFKDPRAMWKSSPVAHFSRVRTPTLLIHSEGDLRCNIEQSEQLHAALVVQRVKVRFVRYPRETSHGMSRNGPPDLRIHRLREITRWWRETFHRHWHHAQRGGKPRERP